MAFYQRRDEGFVAALWQAYCSCSCTVRHALTRPFTSIFPPRLPSTPTVTNDVTVLQIFREWNAVFATLFARREK